MPPFQTGETEVSYLAVEGGFCIVKVFISVLSHQCLGSIVGYLITLTFPHLLFPHLFSISLLLFFFFLGLSIYWKSKDRQSQEILQLLIHLPDESQELKYCYFPAALGGSYIRIGVVRT